MKHYLKKVLVGMLLVAMVFSMVPTSFASAAKGTHDDSNIELNDPSKDSWNCIFNTWDQEFSKVSGVTYDKKTNTLTLNKYVNANAELRINCMGDDFKIKVAGTNELKSINVEGDVWGGSLEIYGNGTLTINKNRESENAIRIYGKVIANSLKVKEGVILKAYKSKENNDAPCIQVEGKNKNSISIAGVASSSFIGEGPWGQCENVSVILPTTCMETTYTDFEGDESQYAAVKCENGYDLFRKTQDTAGGYPVYENAWICRTDDEMAGKVNADATIDALVLDYNAKDADLFAKAGDSGFDGLYYDWDANYFAFCKLEKVLDTGFYFASALEQIDNPDAIPEGWEFKIVGDNYATQYKGDLSMVGKAAISKVKAKKSGVSVSWKAVSGASGYEVRYSTSAKMTNAWAQELAASKKSVTIGNLKSKVKVYVQVRAFVKNADGTKSYGAWSSAKNAKTK